MYFQGGGVFSGLPFLPYHFHAFRFLPPLPSPFCYISLCLETAYLSPARGVGVRWLESECIFSTHRERIWWLQHDSF